jgi:Zn-dependent protease
MPDLTTLAIILGCILVSMTLHEAMHAYVGYWLGDDTAKLQGRLTLNPLAHIDPIMTVALPLLLAISGLPPFGAAKPVPFNPNRLKYGEFGAALVGAAGPLTNLLLAIVAGLILRFTIDTVDPMVGGILYTFILVNASFFLFNIIPFPPLDGSRVLYALAPDPVRRVMEQVEAMGIMAILFFFVIFSAFLARPFSQLLNALISVILGGQVTA